VSDPEIAAIAAVATALTGLEEDARGRVLRWATERYRISVPTIGSRQPANGGGKASDSNAQVTEKELAADALKFEHFAEFFAKARPKSDADKALVAAYWVQAIKGEGKWQAASLQKELKNLGHAIGNITDALTTNMQRKPQRVIQLQKAGNARQARKTYKVTEEGLIYVREMIGGQGA
jgi:hypothetical protein